MLLAVDTSTRKIGLALYDGVQVLGELLWQSKHHHTIELAPAVDRLLRSSGLKIDDVQASGVALGPGSFTSLRVGMAFVKGLALARHIPLLGIPTLDVQAASVEAGNHPLAAVLQAGRGRLAVGWYTASENGWQSKGPAMVVTVNELANKINTPTIVCGELSADERRRLARKRINVLLLSPAQSVRRAGVLAELAWKRWQAGEYDDVASLAPIYLHIGDPIPS
jgi:tRNA threonylcarbamoyladenosine biosynthesis protein TsaB